jgi:DNA processing protein
LSLKPDEALDRLRLARTEGVGPITYRRLLQRYGSAAAALDALPVLAAGGRGSPPAPPKRDAARRETEALHALGGAFLFMGEPHYPALLALLEDAPPVLAVLGRVERLRPRTVAIVGSRGASANGQRFADQLAESLARAGVTIVSGLARGIDAAAHLGGLAGGSTAACVAGGLDQPYPPENASLQARIAECGVVFAEAPLGMAPQARHFPRRNRLIAGLSLGVVVVEAAHRSGSLLTARLAHEAGRELFAVPGSPLDPRCRGSNALLREGAHLTEQAADVLDNLPDHPQRLGLFRDPLFAADAPGMGEEQTAWAPVGAAEDAADLPPAALQRAREVVEGLMSPEPTEIDDLVRRCHLSAAAVRTVLLELELAGRVQELPGGRVALLMPLGAWPAR